MILELFSKLPFITEWSLKLHNKNLIKSIERNRFPDYVHLTLSRICDGGCIFCPISNKSHQNTKDFMGIDIVKKICDDLNQSNFIGDINIAGVGDALLNPEFEEITQYISSNLEKANIIF